MLQKKKKRSAPYVPQIAVNISFNFNSKHMSHALFKISMFLDQSVRFASTRERSTIYPSPRKADHTSIPTTSKAYLHSSVHLTDINVRLRFSRIKIWRVRWEVDQACTPQILMSGCGINNLKMNKRSLALPHVQVLRYRWALSSPLKGALWPMSERRVLGRVLFRFLFYLFRSNYVGNRSRMSGFTYERMISRWAWAQ
jgi:hypothetical protein